MTRKPQAKRKPKLGRIWAVYGVFLKTEGITLEIWTPDTWNGANCAVAYPDEVRRLATRLNQWADWAESRGKK